MTVDSTEDEFYFACLIHLQLILHTSIHTYVYLLKKKNNQYCEDLKRSTLDIIDRLILKDFDASKKYGKGTDDRKMTIKIQTFIQRYPALVDCKRKCDYFKRHEMINLKNK